MPDISIAAKRYDGGSGAATFTGVIPLKPGQLFETNTGLSSGTPLVAGASLRGNISLWTGAPPGSADQRAFITALYPQHPDGSIKCVMVSTAITLASGVEQALTLKIGTSPSQAELPTAHPTINATWMKFPLLIGCVDSTHMCQSRVAFGPLVPVNDPRLPVNWQRFLTEELENGWTNGLTPVGGSGGYPTYKLVLKTLRERGDMGVKLCTLTAGSPVVTILGTGWPTAAANLTDQLTAGMNVDGSAGRHIPSNATILSIQPPNQVTLNVPAGIGDNGFFTGVINYEVTFGWTMPFPVGVAVHYDTGAPLYYRYLTAASGHLDKLREAHLWACSRANDAASWNGKASEVGVGLYNYGNGERAKWHQVYTTPDGVTHQPGEVFQWDEYGQVGDGGQANQETTSGFHQSAYICHVLSGWLQPLGVIMTYGISNFLANSNLTPFRDHPWPTLGPGTFHHTPSQTGGSVGGQRYHFRWAREAEVFLYLLSLPFNVRTFGGAAQAPSPRVQANKDKYKLWFKKRYFDSAESWAAEFTPSGATNSFLVGKWGFNPLYTQYESTEPDYMKVRGMGPVFQHQLFFDALMAIHLNIEEDPRFAEQMGILGQWIANGQQSGIMGSGNIMQNANATARASNPPIFLLPYRFTDPVLLSSGQLRPPGFSNAGQPEFFGSNWWSAGICLAMLTYAWRVTGDPKLLAMIDGHATIYSSTLAPNLVTGGSTQFSWKELGEMYHMSHYAAAWRAGETWGVTAGAVTLSPPVITDAPYEAGETTVTGTGVAGGTVTLFRNGVAV